VEPPLFTIDDIPLRTTKRRISLIADLEGAGFVLDGESNELANPEDDHTKGVFDPEILGRTDRYVLRFRKPE
jgi:predicted methyltransferase